MLCFAEGAWVGAEGFYGAFGSFRLEKAMKLVLLTGALSAAVCMFTLLSTGCRSLAPAGIPNFHQVAPGVYRGGQPTTVNDWLTLRNLGVTNVIKLNLSSEGSDTLAEAMGMRVLHLPIDMSHQAFIKPGTNVIRQAVGAIKPGTFIHCLHGQDRTGLVIACKRVWQDGWTKERAQQEMLALGFHVELVGLYHFWLDEVHAQPASR